MEGCRCLLVGMCRHDQTLPHSPLLGRSRNRRSRNRSQSRRSRTMTTTTEMTTMPMMMTSATMTTMPMMMPIPGMKPMMKTKTMMDMPVLEKTNEPTMTDDEIVLWLITKATMEDKPVMRLAADRIIQMAQALRIRDDDREHDDD